MVYLHLWQYWVVLLGFIFTALAGLFIGYVTWLEGQHCPHRGYSSDEAVGIFLATVFLLAVFGYGLFCYNWDESVILRYEESVRDLREHRAKGSWLGYRGDRLDEYLSGYIADSVYWHCKVEDIRDGK